MSISVYILHLIAFIDLFAIGVVVPLVPGHVRSLGGTHIHVGLLGSIYAAFQFFFGPLIGSLSDLQGRRTILMVTLVVCSIAYVCMGMSDSVNVILCLRVILGIFKQTQMLTRAMVPEYVPSDKHSETYGKMAAVSGVGITLGPVLGGHVVERYPVHGFQYTTMVVGLCFLLNTGLVYFLPKAVIKHSKRKKKDRRTSKNEAQAKSAAQLVWLSMKQSVENLLLVEWARYWDVFLLKALISFAMSVYYSSYNVYLKTIFELSPKNVGYIISFQGTVGFLSCYFMGFINSFYPYDEEYKFRNYHVFFLVSISLIGIICSYSINFYVFWLIPLAVGNALGRLTTLDLILKRSHGGHRGVLIGASNSVRSLAGVVAPMVTGFTSHYIGIAYPVYWSLLATLIGLVICYCNLYSTEDKYDYKLKEG